MTKLLKLVERLLAEPPEIQFSDINTLLEAFGFREIRSTGSHHIFRNDQGQNLVVPKTGGKMVKRTYIKQIIRLLDLEIWYAKHKNTK
ncbi:type II toxin-antitoxin system HicA family toxin [Planktothrix serta]|nr:type II toxin-antitoxin system HicA family toxin [Planktothrix serta]